MIRRKTRKLIRRVAAYFDGGLPDHKIEVRHSRMQAALAKAPLVGPPFASCVAQDILSEICEVIVVSDEADGFCAKAVHSMQDAFVLSNDSDFCIFDLGDAGYLPLTEMTIHVDGINAGVYFSRKIKAALGNVVDAAYTIQVTTRLTSPRLIATPEFRQQYQLPAENHLREPFSSGVIWGRFTEVLQGDHPSIYLPFLSEDISRASAWEVGREIRSAAYAEYVAAANVQEIVRKGQRIVAIEVVPHYSVVDLETPPELVQLLVLKWYKGRNQALSKEEFRKAYQFLQGEKASDDYAYKKCHLLAQIQAAMVSVLLCVRIRGGRGRIEEYLPGQ